MKTESDWDQDITRITMEIYQKFPELVKYIDEMPVKNIKKNTKGINLNNLEDYYSSLVELVNNYSNTHMSNK